MIDKSINNIDCVAVRARIEMNETVEMDPDLIYNTTYIKAFNGSDVIDLNDTAAFRQLEEDVCQAEIDSQILDSALNVYTAPFGKYFKFFFFFYLYLSFVVIPFRIISMILAYQKKVSFAFNNKIRNSFPNT